MSIDAFSRNTIIDIRRDKIVAAQPHPLLFATVSGAHLYGFPSPDSDFDLRGVHILPLKSVVGLVTKDETIEDSRVFEGAEMDIVTHDVKKFFGLLLKKNGYVLEQLYSPLIVHATPAHEELKAIVHNCITRNHAHHYFGFAETQWNLFLKENQKRVKPLLYVFRVLLTGINLMRTGRVEANLLSLNEEANLPFIADLVRFKLTGPEKAVLKEAELSYYENQYKSLLPAARVAVRTISNRPERFTDSDSIGRMGTTAALDHTQKQLGC
jgi:predicted nucleotidyltransferase